MRLLAALLAALLLALLPAGGALAQAKTVASCSTLPQAYPVGSVRDLTQDQNGNLCTSGSAGAASGCTPYHLAGGSAASTNSTSIVSGQHVLCSLTLVNVSSTVGYFRLYDSTGAPTCSSATGAQETVPVPQAANAGGGVAVPLPSGGLQFTNGVGFCITGGGTDTDNTNAPTGIYVVASFK